MSYGEMAIESAYGYLELKGELSIQDKVTMKRILISILIQGSFNEETGSFQSLAGSQLAKKVEDIFHLVRWYDCIVYVYIIHEIVMFKCLQSSLSYPLPPSRSLLTPIRIPYSSWSLQIWVQISRASRGNPSQSLCCSRPSWFLGVPCATTSHSSGQQWLRVCSRWPKRWLRGSLGSDRKGGLGCVGFCGFWRRTRMLWWLRRNSILGVC